VGAPGGDGDDAGFERLAATITEAIPFKAETRTSGARTVSGGLVLKGAVDAIASIAGPVPAESATKVDSISDQGPRRSPCARTAACWA